MTRLPLLLAFLLLPVSGCLDSEATDPAGPGEPVADPQDEAGGRQGRPSESDEGKPVDRANLTVILSQDFQIDSVQGGEPIPVTVPEGTSNVYMALDYRDGAYNDASFTLGECRGVAETEGTAAEAQNAGVFVGSMKAGVLFGCGPLPPGVHDVTWKLTGVLMGHITVYADTA